jgi:Protein of unknown function (DUF3800)
LFWATVSDCTPQSLTVHLLYLDESGNENDPRDRFFVLGGISLFERQTYFLSQELDRIQERHFPNVQPVDFHASHIRAGKGFWRKVSNPTRQAVLSEIGAAILGSPAAGRTLYAAVVEKSDDLWGEEAVEKATEEVCRRFDIHLTREYHQYKKRQRGLMIFSEGRFDARAKVWVRNFRRGTPDHSVHGLPGPRRSASVTCVARV